MDKPLFDMKTRLSYNGVPDPFHYVLRLRLNFLRKVSFITESLLTLKDHESCNATGHVTLNMQKIKGKY